MGLFDDKKYESLDDLSKMVEPWHTQLDSILEKLPAEISVAPEIIVDSMSNYDALDGIIKSVNRILLTKEELETVRMLSMSFRLWRPEYDNCTIIKVDSVTGRVEGGIKLVKNLHSVDDKMIREMQQSKMNILRDYHFRKNLSIKRSKEIVEILSGERPTFLAQREAQIQVVEAIEKILIQEDRWRIRSIELFNKVINWIYSYNCNGCSASLANLMKVKIRTHSGSAVYSIEEEV